MLNVSCWKCGKNLEEIQTPLNFRAECPSCLVDLHVCKGCKYYSVGKPNDCSNPDAEYVRDKEMVNFCEFFKIKSKSSNDPDWTKAEEIFGEKKPEKRRFDDLFKD